MRKLQINAPKKNGARSRRRNIVLNKRKKRNAGMSTRSESNVNAKNMKREFASRKSKLASKENKLSMRDARKKKRLGE